MDKYTKDILAEGKDFSIEKFTYPPNVTMSFSHYHNHYEILYILNGERELTINNFNKYTLNSNTLAIIPPNCIHKTSSLSSTYQTRILLAVSENLIERLNKFNMADMFYCTSFMYIKLTDEIRSSIRQILSSIIMSEDKKLKENFIVLDIARLFLTLSEYLLQSDLSPDISFSCNSPISEKINFIIKYIQENALKDITLKSISQKFLIGESYLSRCFKKCTGTTVMSYINDVRLIKAQQFISEGNVTISKIAEMTGFNTLAYFERIFKKKFGITPKQFQRLVFNEKNEKF